MAAREVGAMAAAVDGDSQGVDGWGCLAAQRDDRCRSSSPRASSPHHRHHAHSSPYPHPHPYHISHPLFKPPPPRPPRTPPPPIPYHISLPPPPPTTYPLQDGPSMEQPGGRRLPCGQALPGHSGHAGHQLHRRACGHRWVLVGWGLGAGGWGLQRSMLLAASTGGRSCLDRLWKARAVLHAGSPKECAGRQAGSFATAVAEWVVGEFARCTADVPPTCPAPPLPQGLATTWRGR